MFGSWRAAARSSRTTTSQRSKTVDHACGVPKIASGLQIADSRGAHRVWHPQAWPDSSTNAPEQHDDGLRTHGSRYGVSIDAAVLDRASGRRA
jgi:hypothetical protein